VKDASLASVLALSDQAPNQRDSRLDDVALARRSISSICPTMVGNRERGMSAMPRCGSTRCSRWTEGTLTGTGALDQGNMIGGQSRRIESQAIVAPHERGFVTVPAGVLIVGVYGSGKSSVCEEIAELLESAGVPYGAIDLDWLAWYDAPVSTEGHDRRDPVALANLSAVVDNYVSAGVERFVLAGAVWSDVELAAIRSVVPFPLRVVQLTLPYEQIEERLSSAVTTGRMRDLDEARRPIEQLSSSGVGDVAIANDRPIRQVADEILDWLNWR
jgi:hypothetical protein